MLLYIIRIETSFNLIRSLIKFHIIIFYKLCTIPAYRLFLSLTTRVSVCSMMGRGKQISRYFGSMTYFSI